MHGSFWNFFEKLGRSHVLDGFGCLIFSGFRAPDPEEATLDDYLSHDAAKVFFICSLNLKKRYAVLCPVEPTTAGGFFQLKRRAGMLLLQTSFQVVRDLRGSEEVRWTPVVVDDVENKTFSQMKLKSIKAVGSPLQRVQERKESTKSTKRVWEGDDDMTALLSMTAKKKQRVGAGSEEEASDAGADLPIPPGTLEHDAPEPKETHADGAAGGVDGSDGDDDTSSDNSDSGLENIDEFLEEDIDADAVVKELQAETKRGNNSPPLRTHPDVKFPLLKSGYKVEFRKKTVGRVMSLTSGSVTCQCNTHKGCRIPPSKKLDWLDSDAKLQNWLLLAVNGRGKPRLTAEQHMSLIPC